MKITAMPLKKFLIVFIPNFLVYISYIIYEITIANNAAVRGWWPLALIFIVLFHGIVSVVYCVIDRISPSPYCYTDVYGVMFTLPFVISVLIDETWKPIDWYAVNMGEAQLTTLQAIVNSTFYFPVMAGLILLSHFIIRWSVHSKSSR
jgi:uncharacterized membrane protein